MGPYQPKYRDAKGGAGDPGAQRRIPVPTVPARRGRRRSER